jgi:hypothetical protein
MVPKIIRHCCRRRFHWVDSRRDEDMICQPRLWRGSLPPCINEADRSGVAIRNLSAAHEADPHFKLRVTVARRDDLARRRVQCSLMY